MIVAGTGPLIYIDLGGNEAGMTLQYRGIERGYTATAVLLRHSKAARQYLD